MAEGRGAGSGSGRGRHGASERAMFSAGEDSREKPLRVSGHSISEPLSGGQRDLAVLFRLDRTDDDAVVHAGDAPDADAGSIERGSRQSGDAGAAVPGLRRLRRLSFRRAAQIVAAAVATEMDRGVAFLLMPVFLAIGAIIYFALPFEPRMLHPAVTSATLAILAFVTRARPAVHLSLMACLLVSLGLVAGKIETWRSGATTLGAEVSTSITGRVVAIDDMANGRIRLTLDVISTARPKLRYQPQRVRLSARTIPAGTNAGSVVSGYARLLPPTGPVRPGSYDFSFTSYFDALGASGFFLSNPKLVPSSADMPPTARLTAVIENFRNRVADRIRGVIGGPEGEIAAALIVGVRAGIPDRINEAMRRTGIYHIISISGLHMALVAGTIMGLLRGAFAIFPRFSSRHPVKKYAAAAALASIAAYLVISGVVVAAERSFIMLAVMLVAVLFDRAALTMRNLAISAMAVIVVSPHEVIGPSFQMSFAATAALVGAFAGWSDRRAGRGATGPPPRRGPAGVVARKAAATVVGVALTSIVAGSATALFAIWHFQRVSPLSLFANLAVMPIVSAVMGLAVLAALAMPFGADWPFLYAMGKGLSAMIAISDWISARSPIDAVGLISLQSVVLVTVALVIATMATTWLRAAALPFAIAGLATMHQVREPDMLVSEDARLVALPIGGSELAVSRPKPSQFVLDNWRHALDMNTVVAPEVVKGADAGFAFNNPAGLPPGTPFLCAAGLCIARHVSGAIVVLAKSAKAAAPSCAYASVIVIDDATAPDPCVDPLVVVITKQDLAIEGSAALFFDARDAQAPPMVQFAVETDYRPWHVQRQYTREARGLAPFERRHGTPTWRKPVHRAAVKATQAHNAEAFRRDP